MSAIMNNHKLRVLVLCTGNSARSQMAEGLINAQLADRFVAYSAGTRPTGHVHPEAIAALREIGIDISQQRSKSIDEYIDYHFDLAITVCDDAAENCPIWLGGDAQHPCQKVHIGFPDPAAASPDQQVQQFRVVRDAIQSQLITYLQQWQPEPNRRNA